MFSTLKLLWLSIAFISAFIGSLNSPSALGIGYHVEREVHKFDARMLIGKK